jgi:peroxiredoxin
MAGRHWFAFVLMLRMRMDDSQDLNSTGQNARRHPATVVSWIALAGALLVAGYLIRTSFEPDDLRPGGNDVAGLPAIGERAPNFTAVDASGTLVSLSDFEGRPIWLNFWGSWCPPCRAEAPDMIQAWDAVRDDGIVLVAVSLEEPSSDAFEYANEIGMEFVVLSDCDRQAIDGKYRVRSFPTHLFIDSQGIVRDISLAPMSAQTAIQKASAIR